MKNINEIDLKNYQAFYLSTEKEDFVIQKYTEGGYIPIDPTHYDLVSLSSGTLVCYTNQADVDTYQNHMYETSSGRHYIQLLTYYFLQDIFAKEQIGSFDFYAFFKSTPINPSNQYKHGVSMLNENGDVFNRCDVDKYGGTTFYPVENPYNIIKLRGVLDIAGIGHIAYFNTTNTENQNKNSQANNVSSRTLTGIFKILVEWSNMAEEPFNSTEDPAIIASKMVEELKITKEMIEWLNENQIDMGVYRYLKGETNINPEGVVENSDIPKIFEDFFMSRCIYKNIASLKNYNPNWSDDDIHLLEIEKDYLDSEIYHLYMLDEIQSLDEIEINNYMKNLKDNIKIKSDIKLLYEEHKKISV